MDMNILIGLAGVVLVVVALIYWRNRNKKTDTGPTQPTQPGDQPAPRKPL